MHVLFRTDLLLLQCLWLYHHFVHNHCHWQSWGIATYTHSKMHFEVRKAVRVQLALTGHLLAP